MMGSRPDRWVQGYNVGAVADETSQVIVTTAVTADPTDTRSLPGHVEQVRANTGRSPRRLLADAGIDAYVALTRDHPWPGGAGGSPGPDPGRTLGPGTDVSQAAGQGGPRPLRAAQGDRGAVFGQIKEARRFRGSSLQGSRR
jgi:hypothetical protein